MAKRAQKTSGTGLDRREFVAAGAGFSAITAFSSVAAVAETLAPAHASNPQGESLAQLTLSHRNRITAQQFSERVGELFAVRDASGTTHRATLREVSPSALQDSHVDGFSLVFDLDQVDLDQGQYKLAHAELEAMDLFMAPVDLTPDFTRLQAVFC